jgi:hypothetical protein
MTMKTSAADSSFRKGLRSLDQGRPVEAMAFFEASLRLERNAPDPARRARYASYYGLCLATAMGRKREGLNLCRMAANSDFFTPDILLNLARVLILTGDKKKGWETLMQGLTLDPDHPGLKAETRRMGIRRRPAIPFLDRSHPINRAVGRMKAAAVGSAAGQVASSTTTRRKAAQKK